ncbi:RT0821/Lpp0805 family surface protein [uncultured Enterovirga sp.]|uniref:RT0821/Lpp0805 family surface protein n=1 Tax=uncultured Enterovirga sp. TaxID=2026352 RepID=UPI0035CAF81D
MKRYRAGWGLREAHLTGFGMAAVALLAAGLSGCSIAVPGLSDERVESTGSIGRLDASPLSPDLGQEDWRRAKGALAIALDPQGNGSAVKWDNPDSEIGGTFTPVAQPFVKQNEICRSFIATINFPGRTSSLQGTACKLSADEWKILDVGPWRKPA